MPETKHNKHTIAHLVINEQMSIVTAVAKLHGIEEPTEVHSTQETNNMIALSLLKGEMPSLKPIAGDLTAWTHCSTFSMRNLLKGLDLATTKKKEVAFLAASAERGRKLENRQQINEELLSYCELHDLPDYLATVHKCAILQKELPSVTSTAKERFALLKDEDKSEFQWALFDKNGMDSKNGICHLARSILKDELPRSMKIVGQWHDPATLNGLVVSYGDSSVTLSLPKGCLPSKVINGDVISTSKLEFGLSAEAELRGYESIKEWIEYDKTLKKPLTNKSQYMKAKAHKDNTEADKRLFRHHGVNPEWLDNLTAADVASIEADIDILSRYAKSPRLVSFRNRRNLYNIKGVILKHMLKANVASVVEFIDRKITDALPEELLQEKVVVASALERLINVRQVDGGGAMKMTFKMFVKDAKQLGLITKPMKNRKIILGKEEALVDLFILHCKATAEFNDDYLGSTVMKVIPVKAELFNIFHVPESVAKDISSKDYMIFTPQAEKVLTKHYYSVWTIRCHELEFHIPHTRLPRSYWGDLSVKEVKGDSSVKFGSPMSKEEAIKHPVNEILKRLNVDERYARVSLTGI